MEFGGTNGQVVDVGGVLMLICRLEAVMRDASDQGDHRRDREYRDNSYSWEVEMS